MNNFSLHCFNEKNVTLKNVIIEKNLLSVEIDLFYMEKHLQLSEKESLNNFLLKLSTIINDDNNSQINAPVWLWLDIKKSSVKLSFVINLIESLLTKHFYNKLITKHDFNKEGNKWNINKCINNHLIPVITVRNNKLLKKSSWILISPNISHYKQFKKFSIHYPILNICIFNDIFEIQNDNNWILRVYTINELSVYEKLLKSKIQHIVSDNLLLSEVK